MALSELRRITAGRLPRVAVLALVVIPLLYGGLYLFANSDPYGRLQHVPAALVDADRGATLPDGSHLDAGSQVTRDLLRGKDFDWHAVSEQEAREGVRAGRYDFALTLPADFSSALASSADLTSSDLAPRQGTLVLSTNDANNYLARTIATTVADRVRDALATQVGDEAANRFLVGFSTVHDSLTDAADGADRLAAGAAEAGTGAGRLASGADTLASGQRQLLSGAQQIVDGSTRLDDGAQRLANGLGTLDRRTRSLPEQSRALADGARQVAAGNRAIADVGDAVGSASQQVVDDLDAFESRAAQHLRDAGLSEAQVQQVLDALRQGRQPLLDVTDRLQSATRQLDQLADGADQVAAGAQALADATPALRRGIVAAADGSRQVASGAHDLHAGAVRLRDGQREAAAGASDLATGAHRLDAGLSDLTSGARRLATSLRAGLGDVPDLDDATRAATASTIADPVAVHNLATARAATYGAGLAPFFMALASWIGGYVLFLLVRPLSSRAMAANQTPLRVALAGWLTPALLGAVQASLLVTVVSAVLGIHVAHAVATWALLVLTSVAFIAIIHALNAWLGSVGQFLGLVLMVLQLVSAGGTFPWQTIPQPLYLLHHVLPMGYAIHGLRQLMYGGDVALVGRDVAVLLAYLVGSLLLSAVAARRLRVWSVRRIKPELVL
jgi:putative membrane protein